MTASADSEFYSCLFLQRCNEIEHILQTRMYGA